MACRFEIVVFALVFASNLSPSAGDCPDVSLDLPEFGKCSCSKKQNNITLKCHNQNFSQNTSLQMLSSLSNSDELIHHLTELSFTGNRIPVLTPNVIGNRVSKSFWNLKMFDLSNNNIEKISGKTFHSSPELDTLILNDNQWYVDGKSPRIFSSFFELHNLYLNNAFSNSAKEPTDVQVASLSDVFEGSELYWLEELYLERNSLLSVRPEVFQSLPSLRVLSLKDNAIKNTNNIWNSTCHERTYLQVSRQELCWLEKLDLSNNGISTVNVALMHELLKMKTFQQRGMLDLTDNPLVCDCNMKGFHQWLTEGENKKRIVAPGSLTCHHPEHLKGNALLKVAHEDLKCGMTKGDMKKSTNAAAIVFSVLLCIIGLVLIIVLIMNRESVKDKGVRAFDSARDFLCPRKYSYTGVNV